MLRNNLAQFIVQYVIRVKYTVKNVQVLLKVW